MTFSEMVTKLIDNIQLKQTVTKIKKYIDQIRNEGGVESARRWVIELLQNARDVAFDDQRVKVKIVYDENNNFVTFSHNGRFFRTKDILNIIHQVTSKDKDENSIGQFGTGFMSTYTLSEIVRIDGIAHDDENPNVYKRFTINIDRTKNDSDGIEKSIKDSINDFKKIDENDELREEMIDKDDFNTTFTYYLKTEEANKNAIVGIEDLIYNIKYILLFCEKIESVEIVKNSGESFSNIVYSRVNDVVIDESKNIRVITLSKMKEGISEQYNLIYKKDFENDLTVALEIDDIEKKQVLKIQDGTARIFIDFPLIGSEGYYLPFVVNSKNFFPNEERNLIWTSDSESSDVSIANKKLIDEAIDIYKFIIEYLNEENYEKLENALYINDFEERRGVSTIFAIRNIFMKLYIFICNLNIIDYDEANNKTCIILKNTKVLTGNTSTINDMKKLLISTNFIRFSLTKDNLHKVLKTYISTINKYKELVMDDVEFSSYFAYDRELGEYFVIDRSFSLYNLACCTERIVNEYIYNDKEKIEFLFGLYKALKANSDIYELVCNNDIKIFPTENYEEYKINKNADDLVFGTEKQNVTLLPYSKIYHDRTNDKELLKIAIPLASEKTFTNRNNRLQQFNYNNYDIMLGSVLDNRFIIDKEDLKEERIINDYWLKNYINNKMLIYVSNDINTQSEIAQESAMMLSSYIDAAANYTDNYEKAGFISFTDEEQINSLRSKKELARLTRNLSEFKSLLKDYNIDNIKDLKGIIENKSSKNEDVDFYYDPNIVFNSNTEKEEFAKKVGEFGERVAFEILSDEINKIKLNAQYGSEYFGKEIVLINENKEEKKCGYDFSILIFDRALLDEKDFDAENFNDDRIRRKYVEVKCSTKTSMYNNVIMLSHSQYSKAINNEDDYLILKLLLNTNASKDENKWEVERVYKYKNLLKEIRNKNISILYPTFTIDLSSQAGL